MALLVGELYARVTSDSSAYRRDMQQVDRKGEQSAKLAEAHGKRIEASLKGNSAALRDTDRHAGAFVKTLTGMAAAGGGAGVAVAGGLALFPLLLAGIAAAALSADDAVTDALGDLGSEASQTVREISEPLRDELVLAAGQATAGLRKISPELKAIAAEGGPSVTMLVDGFVRLAVNAMPGARKAAAESQAAFAGLNAMLDRTGSGLSDFFEQTAEAAPGAGRAAGDAGRLIEDLLGSLGALAADLAQQGAGPWSQFVGVVDQTTDSALDLGENALPSVASSASALLSVVSRILDVLGPLAPMLGTIGGVLLSYKAGAAVVGAAGDALTRLGGRMETATVGGTRLTGATRGLGSALGAIGPWGAVAGGSLLALLAVTDKLYGSTDKLAQGLMAGGNAAEAAGKKLKQNAADAAVMQGNANGLVALYGKLFVPTMKDAEKAVAEQRASMTSLQRAQSDAAAAAADHDRAVEKYGSSSLAAASASITLAQRQKDLERAQYDAAQATKTLLDRLTEQQALALGLAGNNLQLRIATTQYESAQKTLNDTLKTGTASALEIKSAKEGVESAALSLIQAAAKESLAHYQNQGSVEAQTAALNAGNAKALELASTMSGPLPAALAIAIANMDDAALSALGATREIDGTGAAVIRLPNGKVVKIEANDYATAKINDVQTALNTLPASKTVEVHIKQLLSTQGPTVADLGNPAAVLPPPRAGGGDVRGGHTYQINEHGQELFAPGMDGAIIPATQTRHLMTLLDAMSDRGAPALTAASSGRSTTVYVTMQAVKSLPTAQQLRDVLHDVDVIYDE